MPSRECASCGLRSCDGVACYTEDRPTLTLAEFLAKYGEEDSEAIERPPYTPSTDYLEWCREADLRKAERAELEPKKRPDGRYEVAA